MAQLRHSSTPGARYTSSQIGMCAHGRGLPLRILVVDDEPDIRTMLRIGLGRWPEIDITGEAADGAEALELMANGCPDAVLLDVRMPNMDGIEAARHIRALCPDIKIIILSAHLYPPEDGKVVIPEADRVLFKIRTPLERLKEVLLEVCV
jgi:CheY-like chemotaxis protein